MRKARKQKILIGAVAVAMTAAFTGPISASASESGAHAKSQSKPHGVNSKKLRKAVTVNGILKHERQLQSIANAADGTRASGTPGYESSVKYVVKQLKAAGYRVSTQDFTFPFTRELAPAELSQVSPTPTDYEVATMDYSGSGDITGLVVPIDVAVPPPAEPGSTSGCEAGDFPAAPNDPAIALIQRGTCTFEEKVDNAVTAGYDAVAMFNEGQQGRTELLTGTLGNPKTVPVIGMTYEDGAALYEATQAGDVTARAFASTETDLERTTTNVIADSPKTKKNEVVVVGAHLDSVVAGPGINDNGSGAATVLEIAKQMAKLKYTKHLQRQVRFSFWGAEESGLLGSEHYVDSLSDNQRSKIYANLNFDMVGSPNYVRFVYDGDGSDTEQAGPPGSDAIEKIFTDYFKSQHLTSEPTAFDGRSDYGPFIAKGIPAGGLFSGAEGIKTAEEAETHGGTAGEAYDPCYHQACDTITNLSTQALYELGDAAAHATLTLTKSKRGLYPDGSVAPQKKSLKAPASTQKGHATVR